MSTDYHFVVFSYQLYMLPLSLHRDFKPIHSIAIFCKNFKCFKVGAVICAVENMAIVEKTKMF